MKTPTYTTTDSRVGSRYEATCATLCEGMRLRVTKTGRTAEEARHRATTAIEKMIRQVQPEQPEQPEEA